MSGTKSKKIISKRENLLTGLARLVALMERLRGPKGCPWDRKQTFESLIPFLVEEAYEVIGAIDTGSLEMLKEELGDLLFQIIFLCQLAREKGAFDMDDVMTASREKMIRRHPHVFGKAKARTPEDVLKHWARIKRIETAAKKQKGFLSDIPAHLPALLKAHKVTEKAAWVGFDWSDINQVFKKIEEEVKEFKAVLRKGNTKGMEEELGDLIFSLVNVGRFIQINTEEALRKTIGKFITRFHYIEESLRKKGKELDNASLDEMEKLWNEAKSKEKNQGLQSLKKISPLNVDKL
ncbi:MAG: nucleoside triphosphate pyrophosphohydrolase [Deltaproteobacteria bacterium]|nr:nucleoside triphosphate pyrophosphohydrolase [Deltaproteobacteria bacterium]